jgi:ADP-ribose pyrophosphatase
MPRITAIELVADRTATARCDEGFLRLKRYRAQNRRDDGSASREYDLDLVDRPTLDAVAVCAYARTRTGVQVLTRAGLRPAAMFRPAERAALPEPKYLLVEELVAGVLEVGERGLPALQHRAAEELFEEAGLRVPAEQFSTLGGPFFVLPGIVSEKIHLFSVEVPRGEGPSEWPAPGEGDGSPLEEGALLRWRELGPALSACEEGEIEDAKTELAFRRLARRLGIRL